VLLDDLRARVGGVRVDAERLDPERAPHRLPPHAGDRDRLDRVELEDAVGGRFHGARLHDPGILHAVVSTGSLLAFAVTAFALIVVPGPSVLFVISRGVALGGRAAVATVIGNAAGAYSQVVVVALGLGAIIESSAEVFTAVKLVGAAYVVFLGVQAIRHRRKLASVLDAATAPRGTRRILREGYVVGITNPKAAVFMAAVLPQFTDPARGHVPIQLLLLGLVFVGIALVSDSVWGLAAGYTRGWLGRSPQRLEALGGLGGLVMIGLGVRLALVGRRD
jgi:threonine/homoserine/homoserine lactone efflux protein